MELTYRDRRFTTEARGSLVALFEVMLNEHIFICDVADQSMALDIAKMIVDFQDSSEPVRAVRFRSDEYIKLETGGYRLTDSWLGTDGSVWARMERR